MEETVTEKHGTMDDEHEPMHDEMDTSTLPEGASTLPEGAITEQTKEEENIDDTSMAGALSGITKVIEGAADKTVKVHSLDIDLDRAEDDDYWDHSIKREDEDYEAPKVAESNEQSDLTPGRYFGAIVTT
ncbi:hypothetical protein COOONC_09987 [Cooperia oncophora]